MGVYMQNDDISKNFGVHECLIIFFIILIFILIFLIFGSIFLANPNDDKNIISSNITVYASLVVGLISAIGITYSNKHTLKSLKLSEKSLEKSEISIQQTNDLINQNYDSLFVQLRFHEVEKALYDLMNELQLTLRIFDELLKLNSDKLCFDHKGFLLIQYVNIVSDLVLLKNIPVKLRSELQYPFLSRLGPNLIDKAWDYLDVMNNFYDGDLFETIYEELYLSYEFEQIIIKFNSNCRSDYFARIFLSYYSSNVTVREIAELMAYIIDRISKNKPEDLILEEKDLKINQKPYMSWLYDD